MSEVTDPPEIPTHQKQSLGKILGVAFVAALLLVLFGYAIQQSSMLSFPEIGKGENRGGYERYFMDALDYRERRLTLALVLRTFITSFSFIIGLALCTHGGIFIMHQVKAFSSVSASLGAGKALDSGGKPATPSTPLFSLQSYSPGVMFMAGGVLLMIATQYFAIEIDSPEIAPTGDGGSICYDSGNNNWVSCTARKVDPPLEDAPTEHLVYCEGPVPPEECNQIGEQYETTD
ncbi:MAG: hypothetical protein GQ535_05205 [Rhodobacteraceae bacterium]|nr:hypothetical protein [Paracoccaceae bacterium]